MRFSRLTALAFIAVLAVIASVAIIPTHFKTTPPALTDGDTLKKIAESRTFVLGYRESSIPFSYYDNDHMVIGYGYDLAMKIADAVRTELNLPMFNVKLVPITPQNRFTLIQNGTIDLECGSTGNTAERQNLVAFSNSFFVGRMRLMTRNDYGINEFADLAGKTVVTTAGTTSVVAVNKMNDEMKMGMNILVADDHREAFLMLETKRAVAFLMDDVLLNGERIKAVRWGDWIITGTPQAREPYGCIMRKNDPKFKQLVDRTIAAAMASGEVEKLYKKWFMSPIPPNEINLNFPMSEDLIKLLKEPNDKPFD